MGATGTAILDFGAFPGKSDTSVAVAGQAGIVAGSLVEAWVRPVATADHSTDEHLVESLKVVAGNIVPGTGFTVFGFNDNPVVVQDRDSGRARRQINTAAPRISGQWTVAWAWN